MKFLSNTKKEEKLSSNAWHRKGKKNILIEYLMESKGQPLETNITAHKTTDIPIWQQQNLDELAFESI